MARHRAVGLISLYLYFEFLMRFLALRRRWHILLLRFSGSHTGSRGAPPYC